MIRDDPFSSPLTRRGFLRVSSLGAAGLAAAGPSILLGKRVVPEEDALLGSDPDRLGPYKLGAVIRENALRAPADLKGCRIEGVARTSFPRGRLLLENGLDAALGQKSNFVLWMPWVLPGSFAASWQFRPLSESGLCMALFGARGRKGEDLFSPTLTPRSGEYPQYHHGDIDLLHLSYFRRSNPQERSLHVCNLRKSYGFHLVAEGADPLPSPEFSDPPYAIDLIKLGPEVAFFINRVPILSWKDDGTAYGPFLGEGYLGLRQMAPLQAEYENLVIRSVTRVKAESA